MELRLLEKNAIGCHVPSSGDCWEMVAPVAKSDKSASTCYIQESSGNARVGAEVIWFLSLAMADCSASPHLKGSSFFVRSKSAHT